MTTPEALSSQFDDDDDDAEVESPRDLRERRQRQNREIIARRGVVEDPQAPPDDRLSQILEAHQLQPDDFDSNDPAVVDRITKAIAAIEADFADIDVSGRYAAAYATLKDEATRRRLRLGLATLEDLEAHLSGQASPAARDRVKNSLLTLPSLPAAVAIHKLRSDLQASADRETRAEEERVATNQARIDKLQAAMQDPETALLVEIYIAATTPAATTDTAAYWAGPKAEHLLQALQAHLRVVGAGEPDFLYWLVKTFAQLRNLRFAEANGAVRLLDPFVPAALLPPPARSKR